MATLSPILLFDKSKFLKVNDRHLGDDIKEKTAGEIKFEERLSEVIEGIYYHTSRKGLTDSSVMPVFSKL